MRKKQNFKVLLFLLLGIIIVSCAFEDDEIQVNQKHEHTNAKVTEMKYNDLFKTTNFNKSIQKIPKHKVQKKDAFGRSVMEDSYGFTIYDAPVKVTETEEKLAYSILIKSDTIVAGNYFENLIINIDKETFLTDIAKVKYNLTSEIITTEDNSIAFSSTNEIKYLVDDNVDVSGKQALGGGGCPPVDLLLCNWGQNNYVPVHPAGPDCNNTFTVTLNSCTGEIISTSGSSSSSSSNTTGTSGNTSSTSGTTGTSGTSGTSSSSGTSGTSSTSGGFTYGYDYTTGNNNNSTYTGVGQTYGSGGGGGLGNPIIINVVPPCPTCPELEDPVIQKTPCESLNDLKKKSKIASALYELEDEIGNTGMGNVSDEAAFMVDIDTNKTVKTRKNFGSPGMVKVKVNQRSFGALHVHNLGVDPMFDPGDLLVICKMANTFVPAPPDHPGNYYNPSIFFNIMVVSGYAYAVVPNNIEAFKTKCDYLKDNWIELNLKIEKEFKKIKMQGLTNQLDFAKVFLDFINNPNDSNLNFNVSLYRISTSPINQNEWKKLTLNNTKPNGISEDSCN